MTHAQDEQPDAPTGFTYDRAETTDGPEALLNLLLEYRDVESALRRRMSAQLQVGDTEVLALRYLARAAARDEPMRPSDLRDLLGLTTGSTTALIDRLQARGLVGRAPHPTDRRSVLVSLDRFATPSVQAALDEMQASLLAVTRELEPVDLAVVEGFLRRLITVTRAMSRAQDAPGK